MENIVREHQMGQYCPMHTSILRIDPTLPVCWEDTETLRFGFDRAEARVHSPSAAEQRLISALLEGVHNSTLGSLCKRLGVQSAALSRLLEALAPVLLHDAPSNASDAVPAAVVAQTNIAILGTGSLVDALQHELQSVGMRVETDIKAADFIVIVERFLEATGRNSLLLAPHTPQLPIRFTDRRLVIGPVVTEQSGPCYSCVELHRLRSNPHAPVLAAQLHLRTPAAAETPASVALATASVSLLIQRWRAGLHASPGQSYVYQVRDGFPRSLPELEIVEVQRDCLCSELAAAA